ncbi:MAG: hypothetical protein ACYCY1_02545 [Sulfuriferula sp.]
MSMAKTTVFHSLHAFLCWGMLGHVGAVWAWRIQGLPAAPTFQKRVGACWGKPVHRVPRRPVSENAARVYFLLPHIHGRKFKDDARAELSRPKNSWPAGMKATSGMGTGFRLLL